MLDVNRRLLSVAALVAVALSLPTSNAWAQG
jgi:hypothetical protein